MKFIRKIRYAFVVSLMLIMTTTTMNINVSASKNAWQEAYLEVIKDSQNDSSVYLLHYIDDDEIPELYMWDNQHQCYALYTYNGNELIQCGTWRNRESIWFYSDRNGYFWSTYSTNAAYQYNIFHKLENGSCNNVYSFCIDKSEMPVETYLINDEDVGKEEYERQMAKLESEYPLSSDFQMNGKLNQTYDEIREYLLDSMENENNSENDEQITSKPTETEQTTEAVETAKEILSTESTDNAEAKVTTTINTKRLPSPKTGDSEPIFCELIIIGFTSASIIALMRKKYK